MFEATLMTFAPQDMKGRVNPSSPERTTKFSSNAQRVSETFEDLPPASLRQQMWKAPLNFSTVEVEISIPHLEGIEYSTMGFSVTSASSENVQTNLLGLVCYSRSTKRNASAPKESAFWVKFIASDVEFALFQQLLELFHQLDQWFPQ